MQNGYKARVVKIENCGGDAQIIKVDPNMTMSLNQNCDIIVKGCGETKAFKTAKASPL